MTDNETLLIKKSIGRRLAESVAGAAFLLSGLLAIILIPLERATEKISVQDQVGLLAESFATTFALVDETTKSHPSRTVMDTIARSEAVDSVEILDHEGRVKFSTTRSLVGQTAPLPKYEAQVIVHTDQIDVVYPMPWERSCVGCHDAGHDPVGGIRLTVSRDATIGGMRQLQIWGALGISLVFVILVALILFIARRIVTRPVFRLARVMAKAESGNFMVRAYIENEDEIGALGMAFNRMLKNITSMKAAEIEREADLARAQQELILKQQLVESAEQLSVANSALEKRVRAQEVLMDAAHRLSSTLDQEALLNRLLDAIVDRFGHEDFFLALVEHDPHNGPEINIETSSGVMNSLAIDIDDVVDWSGSVVKAVIESGHVICLPNISKEQTYDGIDVKSCPENGTLLVVPLMHKGDAIGAFCFVHRDENAYDEDEIVLLEAFGAQVATALVNADLYQRTKDLSLTDPLTGLMNRRAMERRLEVELVRAQRFGLPLAILMIDVDHFKAYNDRMGHLLGDEALKEIARTLQESVRKVDAVARFGGEELCVILPRTEEEDARDVATKLLGAVRDISLPGSEKQPLGHLSISVGVGVYPTDMPAAVDGPQWSALLDVADRAVFTAKDRGRDRVVTGTDALSLSPKLELDELGDAGDSKKSQLAQNSQKGTDGSPESGGSHD